MWNMQRLFYRCDHSYRVLAYMWVCHQITIEMWFGFDCNSNFVHVFLFQFVRVAWSSIWRRTIPVQDVAMLYISRIHCSTLVLIEPCKISFTNWFQTCKEVSCIWFFIWSFFLFFFAKLCALKFVPRWNETRTGILQEPQLAKSKRSATEHWRRCIRSIEWNACWIRLSSARRTG